MDPRTQDVTEEKILRLRTLRPTTSRKKELKAQKRRKKMREQEEVTIREMSLLEQLHCFGEPDIQAMIYAMLDVPAKRRCLAVSKTLRSFVLEKGDKWEEEERRHNWMEVERPVPVLLDSSEIKGGGFAVTDEHSSDVYVFSARPRGSREPGPKPAAVALFRDWSAGNRREGTKCTRTLQLGRSLRCVN